MAFFYAAAAYLYQGNLMAADLTLRRAVELSAHQALPQITYLLAIVEANQGYYRQAIQHLEEFIKRAPQAPETSAAKQQLLQLRQLVEAQHAR